MKTVVAIMKTAAIIWSIISFFILAYIAFLVVLAVSKSTYLKTGDGRETNYFRKMGMIHYRQHDNVFSLIYSPVRGANAKTFKPLDYSFGKDKKYVFYRQTKQPHVDCATFEITADGIMRDKNFVYDTQYSNDLLVVIEGADPKTFEIICNKIGKDSQYIYYGTKRQAHVDYETFEIVFETYTNAYGDEKEKITTMKDKNDEYNADWEKQMLVPKERKKKIQMLDPGELDIFKNI
jgi:hypothetical protein